MKKYLILIIVILLGIIAVGWHQMQQTEQNWKVAEANVKAYSEELSTSNKKNIALQLSIDQLCYFNDSILQELDDTRRDLNIKDKNLKALQAVHSSFVKKDTIRITQVDTLFREPSLNIDTMLADDWYSIRLGLKYPSIIAVQPEFRSVKYIVVSSKKETVNPPKRFFLARCLQKKHYVLNIDVVEKNPYVNGQSSKYVEIIK